MDDDAEALGCWEYELLSRLHHDLVVSAELSQRDRLGLATGPNANDTLNPAISALRRVSSMQRSSGGMSPATDISHSAASRWHGLMTYKPVPLKALTIKSGAG